MALSFGKAAYAKVIQRLIERIYHTSPLQDSLYEQAVIWFAGQEQRQRELATAEQELYLFENRLQQANKGNQAAITRNLQKAELKQKTLQEEIEESNYQRYFELQQLCRDILSLCQSDSFSETNSYSAKMLGTIQLICPTRGKNIPKENQKARHLYKAILSIRLLDRLVMDGLIEHPFIEERFQQGKDIRYHDETEYHPYRDDVHVPILMAAILQDIGRCHPSCQAILKGPDGTYDEFRELDAEERITYLQVNYSASLNFVQEALGTGRYMGRDKDERDRFLQTELEKRELILFLLKQAARPANGIGNVLKIPQIYTAMVLSTKHVYNYEDLPKAALALEKSAELGKLNRNYVAAFLRIVGMFPQGYGVPYIPKDSDGNDMERYEYAIVTGLYPTDFRKPICRIVTYSLTYQASARGCVLSIENNLYFPQARRKLEIVPEERLLEIMRKLVYNFEDRMASPLLPRCWHPDEYFLNQKNQNLWNKAAMVQN
ncbi:hypothetical protein GCM10010919_32720 [Alishewanella longhuensis]|uniref:Uncharacterized protein n=1 Tax=Alishewanella longhuensis TaxID=1091037 RepID=A0ABQ3L207_9ALTE|nr:hypothetical protein [Alishewanella longhuensis]GHG77238.1 hypothetical protein GCM10010919_32720 [Alishewanella longhuensis]